MERRTFLRASVLGASTVAFTGSLWQGAFAAPAQNAPGPYGALLAADANGIRLPAGFTSKVIARSGQAVPGTSYTWHSAPDGGACFADGSGWIYVSNSEVNPGGGASALRFDSSGNVVSANSILSGTRQNCAAARRRGRPGCRARRSLSGTSMRPTPSAAPRYGVRPWAASSTRRRRPTRSVR
ncbi:hypothetical protein ACFQX6_03620 [Streptosporangium lutulentum]